MYIFEEIDYDFSISSEGKKEMKDLVKLRCYLIFYKEITLFAVGIRPNRFGRCVMGLPRAIGILRW